MRKGVVTQGCGTTVHKSLSLISDTPPHFFPLTSPSPASALGPETLSIDYPRVCELARAAARGGEVVVQRREKVEKRPFLGLIERGLFVDRYSK